MAFNRATHNRLGSFKNTNPCVPFPSSFDLCSLGVFWALGFLKLSGWWWCSAEVESLLFSGSFSLAFLSQKRQCTGPFQGWLLSGLRWILHLPLGPPLFYSIPSLSSVFAFPLQTCTDRSGRVPQGRRQAGPWWWPANKVLGGVPGATITSETLIRSWVFIQ